MQKLNGVTGGCTTLGAWRTCAAGLALSLGLLGCDSNDLVDTGAGYGNVGDVSLGDGSGTLDSAAQGDGQTADTVGLTDALSGNDGVAGDDAQTADGTPSDSTPADVGTKDTSPPKYPTCSALLQCGAGACSATGWLDGCDKVCLDNASAAAQTGWAPIATCIDTQCKKGVCAGSSDPNCIGSCVGQKCLTKLAACGADGKTGSANCSSYYTCLTGCKNGGSNCVGDCYAALSAAAQAQIGNVDACVSAAGGADPFATCPEQSLSCLANGATGSATCEEAWACTAGCTGNEGQKAACMGTCFGKASSAAQAAFAKVVICEEKGAKVGCPDAYIGCLNPTGTKTCVEALNCYKTCNQADPVAKAKCSFGCLDAASAVEAKKAVVYGACTDTCNCAGDQACETKCNQTTCKTALDACLGN